MTDSVLSLKDKYAGQTLWVVGKGPSLAYLTPDHIGAGPVIAINESIVTVQEFGLPNDLYSIQKDGCDGWNQTNMCRDRCEMHPPMVEPRDPRVTVILQRPGYSEKCLPDYPNKLYITPTADLTGIEYDTEMSVVMCVELGRQIMGCARVALLCFDSFNGDYRTYYVMRDEYDLRSGAFYEYAVRRLKAIFETYPHTLIIPEKEAA
jgi:hypothetical protein